MKKGWGHFKWDSLGYAMATTSRTCTKGNDCINLFLKYIGSKCIAQLVNALL